MLPPETASLPSGSAKVSCGVVGPSSILKPTVVEDAHVQAAHTLLELARRRQGREDRRAAGVERRVDEKGHARRIADLPKKAVQERIVERVDRLQPRRAVVVANPGSLEP